MFIVKIEFWFSNNNTTKITKGPKSFVENSELNIEIITCFREVLEAIRIMSPTYKRRHAVSRP